MIPLRGHLPALDGLRGLAILSVMVFHFTHVGRDHFVDDAFWRVAKSGWIGVPLFFVLSGFLITRILLNTRDEPGYFRNFYARRSLRIFPLYYGYLLAVTVVLPFLLPNDGDVAAYAADAPWHWLYLSNVLAAMRGGLGANGHLWSLAVEEQFYLVWPLVVFMLPGRRLLRACGALVAFALAFRIAAVAALDPDQTVAVLTLLPARVDALAIGAVLAYIVADPVLAARLRTVAPVILPLTVVPLILIALTAGHLDLRTAPMATLGLPLLSVAFALLIVLALTADPGSHLYRLCSNRWLVRAGKYSYAAYVLHIITGDITRRLIGDLPIPSIGGSTLPADLVSIGTGIGATFALAWVSWHLWEQPWLRLKSRFEYQPTAEVRVHEGTVTA